LGAGRITLVGQLVTESLLVSVTGGLLAIVLAYAIVLSGHASRREPA